jgi:hypothetical protein
VDLPLHLLVVNAGRMAKMRKGHKPIPLPDEDRLYIYENCGDHFVQMIGRGRKGHFVDPLLKLYFHIPLMLVSNDDVPNGHANGTRVLLEAVILKPTITLSTIILDGLQCPCVDATLVDHFICSLDGCPWKVFRVSPKKFTCRVRVPVPRQYAPSLKKQIRFRVSMVQLPLLVNNATTGHKLQGQT